MHTHCIGTRFQKTHVASQCSDVICKHKLFPRAALESSQMLGCNNPYQMHITVSFWVYSALQKHGVNVYSIFLTVKHTDGVYMCMNVQGTEIYFPGLSMIVYF